MAKPDGTGHRSPLVFWYIIKAYKILFPTSLVIRMFGSHDIVMFTLHSM